jgi:cell division protein FtsB
VSTRLHARTKPVRRRATASRRPSGTRPAGRTARPNPAKKLGAKAAKKGPANRAKKGRATTPAGRSAAARRKTGGAGGRRTRMPVVLAAVFALVVLATSFPFTDLLHQHQQLSAEAAQLSQLRHQNQLLSEQQKQLNTSAEIERLARQNYQLVSPGQTLYDILPPSGRASAALVGEPSVGDPANQPLVAPADAPNMTPDPGLPQTPAAGRPTTGASTAAASAPPQTTSSFWGRVTSTLEFWK